MYEFFKTAHKKGIKITLDCGFVPCMFPDETFELLGMDPSEVGNRCNPIPDLLPDGNFISCFPLSVIGEIPLNRDLKADQVRHVFDQKLSPYKDVGIYPHCSRCKLKKAGSCSGGCRSFVISRFSERDVIFGIPEKIQISKPHLVLNQHDNKKNKKNTTLSSSKGNLIGPWSVPYIDQPPLFWENLIVKYGETIKNIYFPFSNDVIGSGRPLQPSKYLYEFLELPGFRHNLLINPITLPQKEDIISPKIIAQIESLHKKYEIHEITLAHFNLAKIIKHHFPDISLTASTLMDIFSPLQISMLDGVFDVLVPSSKIIRNIDALHKIRKAFNGRIRLLVNESCIPHCVSRVQHFHEMSHPSFENPCSIPNLFPILTRRLIYFLNTYP